MTQENRLHILKSMAEAQPDDPFLFYAMALEHHKLGDIAEARIAYVHMLTQFPDYLPTYYHAGLFYQEIEEEQEAISTLRKGITLAEKQSDDKAKRELREALSSLEDAD